MRPHANATKVLLKQIEKERGRERGERGREKERKRERGGGYYSSSFGS